MVTAQSSLRMIRTHLLLCKGAPSPALFRVVVFSSPAIGTLTIRQGWDAEEVTCKTIKAAACW